VYVSWDDVFGRHEGPRLSRPILLLTGVGRKICRVNSSSQHSRVDSALPEHGWRQRNKNWEAVLVCELRWAGNS
jgi:hypothetical protein